MSDPRPADFLKTEAEHQDHIIELARDLGWLVGSTKGSMGSEQGEPNLRMVHPIQGRAIVIECKDQTEHYRKAGVDPKSGRLLPGEDDWAEAYKVCPGVEYYLSRPSDWEEMTQILLPPVKPFNIGAYIDED